MKYSGLFFGLTTIDIQYFVEQFPEPNKKVKTDAPGLLVGGPATNAAVAFSALNGGAHLASATGRNTFSEFILNDFNKNNIRHFNLTGSTDSNPVIASVITSRSNGERTIFTHHPHNVVSELNAGDIIEQTNPDILLLDGFYHEPVVEYAHTIKSHNVKVVLDCGSWKPQYKQLIPLADVVICSADFLPPDCINSNEVVDFLHSFGNTKFAISRGEKNLIFYDGKKRGEVPVEKVDVKDTLGAGDFLHGAFCFFYLESDCNFQLALKNAVKFATFTCTFTGTRNWIKSAGDYMNFAK